MHWCDQLGYMFRMHYKSTCGGVVFCKSYQAADMPRCMCSAHLVAMMRCVSMVEQRPHLMSCSALFALLVHSFFSIRHCRCMIVDIAVAQRCRLVLNCCVLQRTLLAVGALPFLFACCQVSCSTLLQEGCTCQEQEIGLHSGIAVLSSCTPS